MGKGGYLICCGWPCRESPPLESVRSTFFHFFSGVARPPHAIHVPISCRASRESDTVSNHGTNCQHERTPTISKLASNGASASDTRALFSLYVFSPQRFAMRCARDFFCCGFLSAFGVLCHRVTMDGAPCGSPSKSTFHPRVCVWMGGGLARFGG
jgi:hypothetical protein